MTPLEQYQLDHTRCLRLAGELLGGPARAADLDWELERHLRRTARRERRQGLAGHAVLEFDAGAAGHELAIGMERFRLELPGGPLRAVKVTIPSQRGALVWYDFWAVRVEDYGRFYRFLRRGVRAAQRHRPPILHDGDLQRLWDNTIGFLRRGAALLERYGVPRKRGVLLLGEPGNGKTMACRWLRWQCSRRGLGWRAVTAEEYEAAKGDGGAHELFDLDRPGIVFFDDVDVALRATDERTSDRSTFLSGLDGLDMRHGVVYLFTTNARLSDIDSAFRRPGRIDLVLGFPKPSSQLRRRLVEECWHPEIVAHLRISDVVAATDGLSFAELDELKKLLVLRYGETGCWEWFWAWSAFTAGRGDAGNHRKIGFNGETLIAPRIQHPPIASH
ncbi:MAG TPA: ATP-binding protein [Pirellulales bacterium]|nr:ATP-binding protein [Pirellulales bacterium]